MAGTGASDDNRHVVDEEAVRGYLADTNWGRWGDDDQLGAVNLITSQKILEAVGSVRIGRTLSLSRPFPTVASEGNTKPAEHFTKWFPRVPGGLAVDYYGTFYHGHTQTHIDALCHVWDENGMWGGRDPEAHLTRSGATWGDIDQWRHGIVTRGVLLDVTRHRGEPYITTGKPVHGAELRAIADAQGVTVRPGDALLVYSGREAWEAELGPLLPPAPQPGWHASCLPVIKEWDVSVMSGDFVDAEPTEFPNIPWTVHGALFSYGVALVDNTYLVDLADLCAETCQWTFLFLTSPLRVRGGTGSPVNPIAVL